MNLPSVSGPTTCRTRLMIVIGAILLVLVPAGQAAVFGPYTVDGATLHLWHLDEISGIPYITNNGTASAQFGQVTNGVFFDAVTTNPQTTPITLTNTPGLVSQPVASGFPPSNFAMQGAPAWMGTNGSTPVSFGLSDQTTNFSCALPSYSWPNPLSTAAAYTCPTNLSDFINTNSGAFTFEALVRPVVNPLTAGKNMEIFCGDSGFAQRAWQFRLTAAGKLEFNVNLNGAPASAFHDVVVALPTTNSDAVTVGNWYHVAVTYTGDLPTNNDTPRQLKLYWTLMDMARTNADVLWTTNLTYGFTNTALVIPAIGGSGRGSVINNVGNSEGFIGNIDEVRVSSVCRKSTEMIFNTNLAVAPLVINVASGQTNQLVGYGQTLQITATETGSLPFTNQWYQNGVALPGQTNAVLIINQATFAANGNYQLLATNAGGPAASAVCSVNIGATFNGLFNTGVDANGNTLYVTAPGSVDAHYQLTQSADPNNSGPNAIIWGGTPNGGAPSSLLSGWIGPRNGNGSPNGTYAYQTTFQIDNADISSSVLSGNILAGGPSANVVQAFLNGVETDITLAPNTVSTTASFIITNGLQAGSNTLSFTLSDTTGNFPGLFRVELAGLGNALPPGLPTFNSPPVSQTVQYGATALLPVVALGRPPLSYQWLSNGVPVSPAFTPSATHQALTFIATNVSPSQVVGGNFSANYQVVVGNASGSVTSSVATLTIQIPPQTAVSAGEPIWNPVNGKTNLIVTYSQPVDPATSTNAANYALDNGGVVLSAAPGNTPYQIVLTTSVLTPGTGYNLSIQNVQSALYSTISPVSLPVGIYPVCALWLRADTGVTTDANGVNQWNDLSGNGNNLSQTFGFPYEPQLATNLVDGDTVIRFSATNETFMTASDSPTLELTGNLTILAVMDFATLAGNTNGMIVSKTSGNQPAPYDYYVRPTAAQLWRGNGSVNASASSTKAPSVGVEHVLAVMMQGTNVTHRLDGQPNGGGIVSTTIADTGMPLYIGTRADGGSRLSGDMAELIVVGSALSAGDTASLESYLISSHHVAVVNASPTTLVTSVSGSQLTLAWPADHTGWTLQVQTNSLSMGLGTNWSSVAGSIQTNQVSFIINPTNGCVFYRLLYQAN